MAVAAPLIRDLRRRLERARLADSWPYQDWGQGPPSTYLRDFIGQWIEHDWVASQAQLSALPNFVSRVDGVLVYFLWFRSSNSAAIPLLMAHGWPSSPFEFVDVGRRLSGPDSTRPDGPDFDVVVPALPGYLFSEPGPRGTSRSRDTARLWDLLMRGLGYDHYMVHGDDLGGGVAVRLATDFADRVSAIHVGPYGAAAAVHLLGGASRLTATLERDERRWSDTEGAYEHEHSTRPLTLAHALCDSPAGMAAWILEKWRAWTDCDGDLDSVIDRSDLIRLLTLYWCTNTQVTGLLPYWERTHLKSPRPATMTVPVGVMVTREKHVAMPSQDAVAAAVPLTSWVQAPAGGHFICQEQPTIAASMVAEFARHCLHRFPDRFGPGQGRH